MMRFAPLGLIACLCSPAAAALEGTWRGSSEEPQLERIQLSLSYTGTENIGTMFQVRAFTGLSPAEVYAASETPVRFHLEREAGRVEFEGSFREGRGRGRFTFVGNADYLDAVRKLGIDDTEQDRRDRSETQDERLLALALLDVSTDYIRSLLAEGYHETLEQYMAMRIFDVTPDHIRAMEELVSKRLTADELVATRVHGITPEFAREMRKAGWDLSFDQLLSARIHGITPEFAREMREAGWDLSFDQLLSARIHGATPELRAEMEQLGYRVSFDQLMAFRIHGVTPEWIAELRELGYDHLSADELVSTRIFSVTPEFIRSVEAAGYGNLPMSELISMRVHGVDADDLSRRRGR